MHHKQAFNALQFNKSVVIELNDQQLTATDSGSSPVCGVAIASSKFCLGIAVGIIATLITP